jgi:hypothetical protein
MRQHFRIVRFSKGHTAFRPFSSFEDILHVITSFQNTLLSIDNLIPDTTFDNFTRPYINQKYEDKTCGRESI